MATSTIIPNGVSGTLLTQPNSNISTSHVAEKKFDSSEYTKSTLQSASDLRQQKQELPDLAAVFPNPITFLQQELGPQHPGLVALGQGEGLNLPEGRYVGAVLNGKPHGRGVLTYHANDEKGRSKYEGTFVDGMRAGHGVMTWTNGNKYDGRWAKDHFNGNGEWSSKVCTYKGQFMNSKFHGEGIQTDADGGVYEGSFENNKVHGKAKYMPADRTYLYDGNYVEGLKSGYGEITAKNFNYKGHWKNDLYDGKGTLNYGSGLYLRSGLFKNGGFWEGKVTNMNTGATVQTFKGGKPVYCVIL